MERPHETTTKWQEEINRKRAEFDRFWNEEYLPRVLAGMPRDKEFGGRQRERGAAGSPRVGPLPEGGGSCAGKEVEVHL